jgi:hypothetical protein
VLRGRWANLDAGLGWGSESDMLEAGRMGMRGVLRTAGARLASGAEGIGDEKENGNENVEIRWACDRVHSLIMS